MSNLLNKIKAKVGDHSNAVSEDTQRKPTSGVQGVPVDADQNKFGQGGSYRDEQDSRPGSATTQNTASHTSEGTVHTDANGGDDVGGQLEAQQAMENVEQDMGKNGTPLQ